MEKTLSTENGSPTSLQIGWSVVTRDGETLGEVKEIRGRYFNVSVPREPDYWLEVDGIVSTADRRVTMSFGKADLSEDFIELRLLKTDR